MSQEEKKFPGCSHQLRKTDSGKLTLVHSNNLMIYLIFPFINFCHKSKIQFHQISGFSYITVIIHFLATLLYARIIVQYTLRYNPYLWTHNSPIYTSLPSSFVHEL